MNAEVYIFNICMARQTILNWAVLLYPWRIFYAYPTGGVTPIDAQIYAQLNSRHNIISSV
jgi:hypothetical protein